MVFYQNLFLNTLAALLLAGVLMPSLVQADEGMWLFNQVPKKRIQQQYGFQVTDDFLDHLRLSSVRFNNGGSGSFVSSSGLLFTNHHVGSECIHELGSEGSDYLRDGFYASAQTDERKCPNLEVNVLLKMRDVTGQVNGAVKDSMSPAEANAARKAAMSAIEKECADKSGNRCDVVTLYSGGLYHLYEYKKYTDIRLVFAPESSVAAFGGDPDNFTYPRYCLDFALFRVYENGRPVRPEHWLKWNPKPVQEGDLVFITGHPATTGRMATVAELKFFRDHSYPIVLERLGSMIERLKEFASQSEENRRVAKDDLDSFQNSYKAYTGFLRGLRDPKLMDRKATGQAKLQSYVKGEDPEKLETWKEIEKAYDEYASFYKPYWLLERAPAYGSNLFPIARDLVRLSTQLSKPDSERLREYTEAGLESLKQGLYSPAPISKELEILELSEYFRNLVRYLGADDPAVREVLAGRTPEEAARYYAGGTKLFDVETRKKLYGDASAIQSSEDTMIELARRLEAPSRKLRSRYEDNVEAILRGASSKIARIKFAMSGTEDYPDASFTLRLSYAEVRGYTNAKGEKVPYTTRVAGLFKRATGEEPFHLPQSWKQAKPKLDMDASFNFVSTGDTHGGNSGSPTINRQGEVVGILFDGNLEGLPNRFVYTGEMARSVHVANDVITESLRVVYKADRVLRELEATK